MKQDCIWAENAIWDSLAEGTQISEDILRHARQCPDCSRVLAEAKQSLKLLHCAGAYPEVPDCRSAVMSRITARSWMKLLRRFAWVAVPVAAVLAVALVLPMRMSHSPAPVRMAGVVPGGGSRANTSVTPQVSGTSSRYTNTDTAPHVSGTSSRNTNTGTAPHVSGTSSRYTVKPPKAIHPAPRVQEPRSATPRRAAPSRRPVREIDKMAAKPPAEPDMVAMAPMERLYDAEAVGVQPHTRELYGWEDASNAGLGVDGDRDAVVEAVSVNWSSEPDTENVTHQFIEKDDATGTVTMGSVKRTGDTIEIEMDSTPPADPAPVKGEVQDEKNPTA